MRLPNADNLGKRKSPGLPGEDIWEDIQLGGTTGEAGGSTTD